MKLVNLKPINRPGSMLPLHFGQIGIGEELISFMFLFYTMFCKGLPNGRRYRQGRDLADKATRRRIRRWG
jgi:hypothetical protein